MKHSFEYWIEEQKKNNQMSDQVEELFCESVRCHKAGAYRSAIVMGVAGFNMIVRDRIQNEIFNLIEYFKNTNQKNSYTDIMNLLNTDQEDYTSKYNWVYGNEWERILFNHLLKDKYINIIFPNKNIINIRKEWSVWRNKRNIGAHGEKYTIEYYEVESLYSWMKQILETLYPITYKQQILDSITRFFDYNQTSPDKIPKELSTKISLIDSNTFKSVLDILKVIIIEKYHDEKERILLFFNYLYSDKQTSISQFLEENIDVNNTEFNMCSFITDLLCQNPYFDYLENSDSNDKKHQVQQILIINDLDRIKLLYDSKIIDDKKVYQVIQDKLYSEINQLDIKQYNELPKFIIDIYSKILTCWCEGLENSGNYSISNEKINKMKYNMLNATQVAKICNSIQNNSQVRGAFEIENFIKNNYKGIKKDYPEIDLTYISNFYQIKSEEDELLTF